jgi:hypothetical protein
VNNFVACKTRRNIHRGGIKIKINMYSSCYIFLHHKKYKNMKNIEKEILLKLCLEEKSETISKALDN